MFNELAWLLTRFLSSSRFYSTSNNSKMVGLQHRAILTSYNGRPIVSRIWSIERRHFQWSWTTLTVYSFSRGENIGDTVVCGHCSKHKFHGRGGGYFHGRKHIVSGLTLKCTPRLSEQIRYLLVFYSNFGRISYGFCSTVDFMPKRPCWATVTSKLQRISIRIISNKKSPWGWTKTYLW